MKISKKTKKILQMFLTVTVFLLLLAAAYVDERSFYWLR